MYNNDLRKEVMPMVKSQRELRHEGIHSFILREETPSDLKNVVRGFSLVHDPEGSHYILEGKIKSPGPGARSGLRSLHLSSLSEAKDLDGRDSSPAVQNDKKGKAISKRGSL